MFINFFFLQNLETEHEPDTYVKKVFTFGDCLSPTMSIITLNKTAELIEDSKLNTANSIKKNTYTDDICDSDRSIEEAKELIADNDQVLDARGFHVEGWISNAQLRDEEKQRVVVIGNDPQNDSHKVL